MVSSNKMSIIVVLFWCVIYCSCTQSKPLTKIERSVNSIEQIGILNTPTLLTPPGCMNLGDSLFIDESEITNIDWREFIYSWNRDYRENKMYAARPLPIPDTLGFIKSSDGIKNTEISKGTYYRAPKYDNYPVVGISLDQAKLYSEWRSNIVFEAYLINAGIISIENKRSQENLFTIESFLESDLYKENKNNITHYPKYFIPKRKHISVLLEQLKNTPLENGDVNSFDNVKLVEKYTGLPMRFGRGLDVDSFKISNIFGNVSELIDEEGLTFGGNYSQLLTDILSQTFRIEKVPSDKVGFRNMCVWVSIKNDL